MVQRPVPNLISDYQKLGGYDPYMDEYVLSPNTNLLPSDSVIYGCGGASRVYTGLLSAQILTIDAGLLYGNVTVFVVATHEVEVTVTYNGCNNTTSVRYWKPESCILIKTFHL